jgi:membrane fusion protein (multidrug efflux system)
MKLFNIRTSIAITVGWTIALASCTSDKDGFIDRLFKGGGSAVPVTVTSVATVERAYEIKAMATLGPSGKDDVVLPGEATVKQVQVANGDRVASGQTLFVVSEKENSVQVAKYQSEIKDARAELDKNTYLLKNRDRLIEEGKIDQMQYDALDAKVEQDEAKIERMNAELTRMKEQIGDVNVTSPADGTVSDLAVTAGSVVAPGKTLASVIRVNSLAATFPLASYEASAAKVGMPVEMRFQDLSGEAFRGEITKVDPNIDPATNSFSVTATVQNPKGVLKVGMQAEVKFVSPERQRLYIIPEEALIKERRRYFVFTVIDGEARKMEVFPKERQGGRVEIAKGLRNDDMVVVKGHKNLTDGTVVDIWGK